VITNGQLSVFPGNYDDYLYRLENPTIPESVDSPVPLPSVAKTSGNGPAARKPSPYTLRQRSAAIVKKITAVESELAELDAQLKELQERFADPAHYRQGSQVVDSLEKHRELQYEIRRLTGEWEKLTVEAERIKKEEAQS
jgi:hypothetical protein